MSCPRTRASMAIKPSRLKHWIPAFRGDDSQRWRPNGGKGAAVTRAPTTIRDGIQPYYAFRSRRLYCLLHRR
jgi:hypothetical protein